MNQLSPENVKKLKRLASIVDKGNIGIFEYLTEIETQVEDFKKEVKDNFAQAIQEIKGNTPDLNNILKSIKGKDGESVKGDKGDRGLSGKDGQDGYTPIKNRDYFDGKDGKNGTNGISPDKNEIVREVVALVPSSSDGKDGRDGSPDTPEQVRDKLQSLNGNDRLDKSAIKGLDDELRSIRTVVSSRGGGSRTAGVAIYDLSSQLNGVLKTFTIPKHKSVGLVSGSASPWIYRPTTDYTLNGNQITFTSQIIAAGSLASDQTLTVLYTPMFNI